jgi:hypothetical protein
MAPAEDLGRAAADASDTWGEVGLATGPTDRSAAESAVRSAYRAAGLAGPGRVIWAGSPRAGAIAAADEPDRGRPVRATLRNVPWAAARAAASAALGPVGWAQVWTAASAGSWRLVVDRVVEPLRRHLTGDLPEHARDTLFDAVYGTHEAPWLATFAATARVGVEPHPGLAPLGAVTRRVGWWWPYERVAVLSDRPTALHRDNIGRLHRGDGPALGYPDGFGMHAWHGMPIPDSVVDVLPHLTAERITAETNAELRRVMLEHFGYERYAREFGATRQHEDDTGVLWHVAMDRDEDLAMVEVVNSTPEPDGTHRVYWLRVPPWVRTARQGVAWTFDLTEEQYRPLVET